MMNIYLTIAILLANLVGLAIVHQFIKRLDKKQKLMFIGISYGLMYILISIIYWFSGFGIDKQVHEASKNFILYLFVPVNVIVIVPYFATQYMKYKTKKIEKNKFANRLTILVVVLLIVLVTEFIIFKNIQNNIKDIIIKTKNQVTENLQENTLKLNEETGYNEITENEILNEEDEYSDDLNETVENKEITTRANINID